MDVNFLSDTMLFSGMTDAELSNCLSFLSAQEKTFKKDALILHAGDTTKRMGLVLSGSVTIESNDVWGNRTILSHVGCGQVFAETYALLPGEVLLVDVRANENCQILFLRIGSIPEIGTDLPVWGIKLIRNILTISAHKNQTHSREFDIPFDRQQLADYLNLERTNMSKELTKMKEEGLIACRKNHFVLLGKA